MRENASWLKYWLRLRTPNGAHAHWIRSAIRDRETMTESYQISPDG